MLPKYLFYIAFAALFLTGCGLETEDEEDDTSATVEVDVEQNAWLPMSNGTSIVYTDTGANDNTAAISYDVGMSSSYGYSIYKMTVTGGTQNLNLYFRSSSSQIELIGMDGPITASGVDLDYVRFSTPIKLLGTQSAQTTAARAEVNGINLSNGELTVTYNTSNDSTSVYASNGWNLPTLHAHVAANVSAVVAGTNTTFPIVLEFYFTKGIGLVQNSLGSSYELAFKSLNGLPNVMIFARDGNEANGRSVFSLAPADSTLSSSDYQIVNQDDLEALSWLTLQETSNGLFEVGIDTTATLPGELTAIQVLFEHRHNSGNRLSTAVTLAGP